MAQSVESVAIYWDFENLHASLLDQANGAGAYLAGRFRPQDEIIDIATIIEFALYVGPIAINGAFANWVSFNRYKVPLLQSAIGLIQIFPMSASAWRIRAATSPVRCFQTTGCDATQQGN